MISVEKPGSPEELLHFGKKGMKWGVRNTRESASESFKRKNPTGAQRDAAIKKARIDSQARLLRAASETNAKKRTALTKTYLNHPDRATAMRMTRGEKVVFTLLAVGIPGPGTAAAIGYTGTGLAIRKGVERSQRRGAGG